MIIPCIDLMGGKVVQLVRGRDKALELPSIQDALAMFVEFPFIHVIDLDAAMGQGSNFDLVAQIVGEKKVRVGGGIRSVEAAARWISLGADEVIVGTAAFTETGEVNSEFLSELTAHVDPARIVIAIDVFGGQIATRGWKGSVDRTPESAIAELEPHCAGFLCTFVDAEGTMQGTDIALYQRLRAATPHRVIAAGGIGRLDEVRDLVTLGVDVALGMSVYTGTISLADLAALNATTTSSPEQSA